MKTLEKEKKLQKHYENIGALGDDRVTAFDYNLRNLEIECAKNYIFPEARVLDVGSGPGVACFEYALKGSSITGVDYAQSMVDFSQETLCSNYASFKEKVNFHKGLAFDLPFEKIF